MALAIQNGCTLPGSEVWKRREEEYCQIMASYGSQEISGEFSEMLAMLVKAFEKTGPADILGEIYMEAKLGNKSTGQFFTPFNISCMCAELSLKGYDGKHKLTLNEPSCGAGGMILAAAKVLDRKGINYQRCMEVVAQDLDWKSVYMCYVQLSLFGISATVVQGDTLCEPYVVKGYPPERVWLTPKKMRVWI